MPEFRTATDGSIVVELLDHEAGLLRGLSHEMRLLLEADLPRADSVTDRLFPRAHEDEADEAKYQELVGNQLRDYKLEALQTVEDSLGNEDGPLEVRLGGEDLHRWLTFLTDIRLALGTRLEVTEESLMEEPDPSTPDGVSLSVMHWAGWIQEQLLQLAMDDDDNEGES